MKPIIILFAATFALALGACVPEGRYPVSGEECGPDDPVKGISPEDCAPVRI